MYGVIRGRPPAFFEGDPETFRGLRFNVDTQAFEFYSPVRMKDDPRWIDITALFLEGTRARSNLFGTRPVSPDALDMRYGLDPTNSLANQTYVSGAAHHAIGAKTMEVHLPTIDDGRLAEQRGPAARTRSLDAFEEFLAEHRAAKIAANDLLDFRPTCQAHRTATVPSCRSMTTR